MPIECNIIEQGGELIRHEPLGPGQVWPFLYYENSIAKVVLAVCQSEDKGGRIYKLDADKINDVVDEDGVYQETELEKFENAIIAPGTVSGITVTPDGCKETTLLFFHSSMN